MVSDCAIVFRSLYFYSASYVIIPDAAAAAGCCEGFFSSLGIVDYGVRVNEIYKWMDFLLRPRPMIDRKSLTEVAKLYEWWWLIWFWFTLGESGFLGARVGAIAVLSLFMENFLVRLCWYQSHLPIHIHVQRALQLWFGRLGQAEWDYDYSWSNSYYCLEFAFFKPS